MLPNSVNPLHIEIPVLQYILKSLAFGSVFLSYPELGGVKASLKEKDLWKTKFSKSELKQTKPRALPTLILYLPLTCAEFHSQLRALSIPEEAADVKRDGQSSSLGPIASAVCRGRLPLLIWPLNSAQLHMLSYAHFGLN